MVVPEMLLYILVAKKFVFDFLDAFGLVAGRHAVLCEHVDGIAGRAEFAVQHDLVEELVLAAAFVDELGFDIDKVAKAARALVLHVEFQHGACESFAFDFVIGCAYGTEKVNTGLFEPDGVGGMVDDAHGVSFCVADLNTGCKRVIVVHECNYIWVVLSEI